MIVGWWLNTKSPTTKTTMVVPSGEKTVSTLQPPELPKSRPVIRATVWGPILELRKRQRASGRFYATSALAMLKIAIRWSKPQWMLLSDSVGLRTL